MAEGHWLDSEFSRRHPPEDLVSSGATFVARWLCRIRTSNILRDHRRAW